MNNTVIDHKGTSIFFELSNNNTARLNYIKDSGTVSLLYIYCLLSICCLIFNYDYSGKIPGRRLIFKTPR